MLRCLSGTDWGANNQSLKRIYRAVIRSNIDYGSSVYNSANKTLRKKIEIRLCVCCGAFRSSPVMSLQVEVGEMPLEIRRLQLRMRYWSGIMGHPESHPVRLLLKDRWEYEYKEISSFGWIVRKEVINLGVKDLVIAPSVPISVIPPWMFPVPMVDLKLHEIINRK